MDSRNWVSRRSAFPILLFASAAATFLAVFYSDRLTASAARATEVYRNLDRDHSPPQGAYYSGCNEARAKGVAPIYSDEPGYRPEMDGDADGIACEPHRP